MPHLCLNLAPEWLDNPKSHLGGTATGTRAGKTHCSEMHVVTWLSSLEIAEIALGSKIVASFSLFSLVTFSSWDTSNIRLDG